MKRFFPAYLFFLVTLGTGSLVAQVNNPDTNFETMEFKLLLASSKGDTAAIRSLVMSGVYIDTQTFGEGNTSLIYAVLNDQIDALKLLLDFWANPDLRNYYGESPLHVAIKEQKLQAAEILIKNNANINIQDFNGATPLHYAALYGFFYEADMLLYYEANRDIEADDGTTPLMAAVMSGSIDIADILIQKKADVNSTDNIGYTPLLIAAQNGDTTMIDMLLQRGSDLYAKGKDSFNAAGIAIRDDHTETLKYLFRKGNQWSSLDATNLWNIAEKYRRKEVMALLRQYNFPRPDRSFFDEIMPSVSYFATRYQSMTGVSIRIKESMTGLGILAGLDFKPWDNRILIEEDSDNYTQYIDRRNLVWAGVFKEFNIKYLSGQSAWSTSVSAKVGWKYGNTYAGSTLKPEHGLAFIPAASLSYEVKSFNVTASVEYLETEVYKSGPVWVRLGFGYNYNVNRTQSKGKFIRWK